MFIPETAIACAAFLKDYTTWAAEEGGPNGGNAVVEMILTSNSPINIQDSLGISVNIASYATGQLDNVIKQICGPSPIGNICYSLTGLSGLGNEYFNSNRFYFFYQTGFPPKAGSAGTGFFNPLKKSSFNITILPYSKYADVEVTRGTNNTLVTKFKATCSNGVMIGSVNQITYVISFFKKRTPVGPK